MLSSRHSNFFFNSPLFTSLMDKNSILLWALFYFANFGYSTHAVHFISTPTSEFAWEGQSLTLFCQVNTPIAHCDWLRYNSSGVVEVISSSDQNYRLVGNLSDGACHLVLLNPSQENDSGRWRCRLITVTNEPVSSGDANLTVLPHVSKSRTLFGLKPGVLIGSFCAIFLFAGGLLTIFLYKRKQPCLLAPDGFSSRSMLIIPPPQQREETDTCNDNETSVRLM